MTPIMYLTPRQFQRNPIRKKKQETEGPVQGEEMNEPHRWDIQFPTSGGIKTDCDFLRGLFV